MEVERLEVHLWPLDTIRESTGDGDGEGGWGMGGSDTLYRTALWLLTFRSPGSVYWQMNELLLLQGKNRVQEGESDSLYYFMSVLKCMLS